MILFCALVLNLYLTKSNTKQGLYGSGNLEKSWNFILAFSRTGKSWKINAGHMMHAMGTNVPSFFLTSVLSVFAY